MKRAPLALFLLTAATSAAQEPPRPTEADLASAKAHFETGKQNFDALDYIDALSEFREAFGLSHRSELLYNIGLCEEQLGRFPAAIEAYKAFLAEHKDDPQREMVEEKIRDLEHLERQRLQLTNTNVPTRSWAYRHRAGLGLGVTGVVVLGGALATGLVSDHTFQALDARCPAHQCTPGDKTDADRGRALAIASDVTMGAGIAAAVGSVIAFIVESRRPGARVHARGAGLGGVF